MKLIGISCALIVILSMTSGCTSDPAEKDAYFKEGGMDQQVESWEKPGGRH